MALFEFELDPVEQIEPWGKPESPNLSWFALTLGRFWMPVGDQVLFRYREGAFSQFGDEASRTVDYQMAAIADDILGSVATAVAPLPPFFASLASNREMMDRLSSLPVEEEDEAEGDLDLDYTAWRWLAERSPWTGYFVACPKFYFIRLGERLHIRWGNRERRVEGVEIWEAAYGSFEMSVEAFTSECRDFADRLLSQMEDRIARIETGVARAQIPLSIESLREQHERWRSDFDSFFRPKPPDIPWEETEAAIRKIAASNGMLLPVAV